MKESAISFIRGENAFPKESSVMPIKLNVDYSCKYLEHKESYYAYQEMFSGLKPTDLVECETSNQPMSRARKIYRKEL